MVPRKENILSSSGKQTGSHISRKEIFGKDAWNLLNATSKSILSTQSSIWKSWSTLDENIQSEIICKAIGELGSKIVYLFKM